MLAQLGVHPHVVTIYAMGLTEGFPWLAMEYAPATLLSRMAENTDPAAPAEVLKVIEHAARGLAAMHALKPPLIHQDLKPANLLVDSVGHYKITDFSMATVTAANKTHAGGTVRYAAPEMLSPEFGRVGPATDLYALGHIAYEMALGQRAHRGQFPAVFEGNSNKEPSPIKWMHWHGSISMRPGPISGILREFPQTLSEVIARLMAKPLNERYASADELLSDLSVLRGEVTGAPAPSAPAPAPSRTTAKSPPPPAATPANRAASSGSSAGGIPLAPLGSSSPPPTANTPVAAAFSGSPNTRYWVRLRGKVTGPFDLPTLQRQIKQGQVSRLHQVSADQVTWKQAAEVEGLYGPTVV